MVLRSVGQSGQSVELRGKGSAADQILQLNRRIAELASAMKPDMDSADLARLQQRIAPLAEQRQALVAQLGQSNLLPLTGPAREDAQRKVQGYTQQIMDLSRAIHSGMASADLAKIQAQIGNLTASRAVLDARLNATAQPAKAPQGRVSASEVPALEAKLQELQGKLAQASQGISSAMDSNSLMAVNAQIDTITAQMDQVGKRLQVARASGAAGDQVQFTGIRPPGVGEEARLQSRLGDIRNQLTALANSFSRGMDSADLMRANLEIDQLTREADQIQGRLKEIGGRAADPFAQQAADFSAKYQPDGKALGLNSRGPRVEAVQTFLAANGASVQVDGKYGPSTTKAVKDFQASYGLKQDGVAGKNTLRAMAIMDAVQTAKKAAEQGTSTERVAAFQALGQAQAALEQLPPKEQAKLRVELQAAERVLGPVVDPDALADGIGDALDLAPDSTQDVIEVGRVDKSGFLGWLFGANSGQIVEMVKQGGVSTEAGRAAARARLADDWHYSAGEAQAYGKLLADSVKAGALNPQQLVAEIAKYDSRTKGDDVVRALIAELDYKAVRALPSEVQQQLLDKLPPRLALADISGGMYDDESIANQRARDILESAIRGDLRPPSAWSPTWTRADFAVETMYA